MAQGKDIECIDRAALIADGMVPAVLAPGQLCSFIEAPQIPLRNNVEKVGGRPLHHHRTRKITGKRLS